MKMEFVMSQQEIKFVKDLIFASYDQFEEFMKNPDPEKIDQVINIINEQKVFINEFVDKIKTLGISVETNDNIFKIKKYFC